MYCVISKLKELLKSKGMQMSGDFGDAMSREVEKMATAACNRARENGRKTVRGYDL